MGPALRKIKIIATENSKYLKLDSKKRRGELVNEAAERLAEILIMQVELEKSKKKNHGKEKI